MSGDHGYCDRVGRCVERFEELDFGLRGSGHTGSLLLTEQYSLLVLYRYIAEIYIYEYDTQVKNIYVTEFAKIRLME